MVLFCSVPEFESLCCDIADNADVLRIQAKGGSMDPFIRSGDCVDVALCKGKAGSIRKGDIVLFKKGESLYLHRVLQRTKGGFFAKGDMSFGRDGIIPLDDALARVIAIRRGGRHIDVRSRINRSISVLAADSSLFLQYPVLIFRKMCTFGMAILGVIQGLKAYRQIVKQIVKGKVIIRTAGREDVEQLRDLYCMAGHDIRDGLARIKKDGFWLVAEHNGKVVGGLTMTRYDKDAALWVIFGLEVKPLFRGLGIGSKIVEEAVSKARESGATRIGLFVNKRSKPALNLYRRLGFTASDDFPLEFNRPSDEYYLSYPFSERFTEDHLLMSLIRGGSETGLADARSQAKPDWRFVLDKAVQEGIFYPVFKNLLFLDAKAKQIPDQLLERFRQTYYLHISRSTDLLDRIERVLDRIESLKIKVLLFKGPAIDHFIYDGFMRPRLDLDISVRDQELPALETALIDLGYALPQDNKDYPIPEYINSRLFTHSSDSLVPVHLHRNLINNMFLAVDNALSIDMGRVWEQTQLFKNYRYICVLKPELNIIYLCEHGLKHNFEQIVFLYEIERLISYYRAGLDWKKLKVLAQELGLKRTVYYGLYFAKEVLAANIPQDVIDELKPERFTLGEKAFIKNTLNNKHSRYCSYPVYIAMRNGLLKKANFIFRTIFPPGFTPKGYFRRVTRSILP